MTRASDRREARILTDSNTQMTDAKRIAHPPYITLVSGGAIMKHQT